MSLSRIVVRRASGVEEEVAFPFTLHSGDEILFVEYKFEDPPAGWV